MDVFFWIAVAAVSIVSSSRLTRFLTFDEFPPVTWFRDRFDEFMDKGPKRRKWGSISYCPWCASFWVTLAVVLAGYYSDWHTVWWLVNGTFAGSYLAAMLMVRDGDDSDDSDEDDIPDTLKGLL